MSYTLPTEAQWEYACRAGTSGMSWLGDFTIDDRGRSAELEQIAWYVGNSNGRTQFVARKPANPWGFHDMLGNVREWVSDRYGRYNSTRPVTDPSGPSEGPYRVNRGGSMISNVEDCRSAGRGGDTPTARNFLIGFRLSLQTGD